MTRGDGIERERRARARVQVIERLYIERLPDGGYDVVCNDYAVTSIPPKDMFPEWVEQLIDVGSCLEVMTQSLMDDLENEDDVAGVRVGYQVNGLLAIAYGDEVRYVPDFLLADAIRRLVKAVSE